MRREVKIWGQRWLLREDSTHSLSLLSIKGGYKCSWHSHNNKYNLFAVISGELHLLIDEMGEKRRVVVEKGKSFTIKPGQWHQFMAYVDTEAIEEMYVEYDESDIIRQTKGGKI